MARTVTPDLWRAVLKGETIRRVRCRGIDMSDCEIDIEFKSGSHWRITPTEGSHITAALVNITRHSQQMQGITLIRLNDERSEYHFYGAKSQRILTVYAEGTAGAEHHATLVQVSP